ncbi:hypothetical protein HOU02_gp148 [Caulobacter phage CcrBL9]|uniref:Uncharacterized protein n=1 Tax=Caulobacter phage CcrBL9 TaxID=2283270 RepID=A0A385EFL4_9CAUD|nr:hypothetical protein HOU02_gp037 [Caulobacter phage CcrBL9]YP_009810207.1 hypothetical protein HOU02_gp148 [Caulobacter phage CcrBL9]AXQ69061.1 hypothetical protein CcrBL9_gp037 [Caulobacter phage CcrBL9]AXQ69577.1 hypothetical protein CcrBL9_gp553 [Caulobacter phage CcrBL9]
MLKIWRERVETAKQRLSINVLVGRGFLCVLEREPSGMAIGPTEDDKGWRLVAMNPWFTGCVKWAKADAEQVAAHWNANLTGDAALYCVVKVMHYRAVLEEMVTKGEEMIAFMEDRYKAA